MVITPLGLLDGLTAAGIIISAATFGMLSIYHAKKEMLIFLVLPVLQRS